MAMTATVLLGLKTVDGSIKNWVNSSTIPSSTILVEAEAWIYERLRVREMLTEDASFTFDEDASSEALPTDFLDAVDFVPHEWGDALTLEAPEFFRPPRDSSGNLFEGTPSRWTIKGTTAYVDVTCESDFAGVLTYYARPAALAVSSNETNFLTLRYPTLLRRACTAYAYEHMKDAARMRDELALAEAAIAQAGMTNDLFRRGMRY